MSPALILDTGVLLWMSQGSEHLGPRTRAMIEEADQGGSLSFSAVSMLEVARLHWDGRIDLRRAPELWHRELIDRDVREIPVTAEMALLAAALESREGFGGRPRRSVDRGDRRRCAPPTRHLRPEDPALVDRAHRAHLPRRSDLTVNPLR